MAKTSRKPLVVTRTTLAPRRSRRMLVATVIPCTKRETENGATPARPRTALAAPSTPRDCGSVDGTLAECRRDASVNVPPTSTPKKTASSKRPAVLRYGGGPSGSTQVGLLNLRIVKGDRQPHLPALFCPSPKHSPGLRSQGQRWHSAPQAEWSSPVR